MKRMPKIKSAMTAFPYSIEIHENLTAARAMMDEHGIHHLPVADDGRLVGVISTRDIDTALAAEPDTPASARGIRSCYSTDIYVVGLSTPLDEVLLEMAERHIRCAVVLKGDKLAGIFTVTDACLRFAELLRSIYQPTPEGEDDDGGDDDQAA
jgi:acetoin utilization protein AcuB